MIAGITIAFTASALLLVILNKFNLPSIPIYLSAGILTGLAIDAYQEITRQQFQILEQAVVQDLIFIGLGFLVFISISQVVLDKNRETSLNSFKTAIFISTTSLLFGMGASLYLGLNLTEAFLIGFAAAFGSSLANFDFVEAKARENHIYGWIIEDLDLYQDILAVIAAATFVIIFSEMTPLTNVFVAIAFILGALILRTLLNKIYLRYEFQNEILMLLGVTVFVGLTLLAEQLGLTALTGILAAGLIFIDTELGFQIHERLSPLKDFFTVLSFYAIGLLLTNITLTSILIAAGLTIYVAILRPAIQLFALNLQGYDLRTSYLTSLGNNEISEITVLTALLLLDAMFIQAISNQVFVGVTLGFALTMIISHSLEYRGPEMFERYLPDYEFDPERQKLPVELKNRIILAGFDDKTQGLVELLDQNEVIAVDYSLEKIEEAEKLDIYHILGDLNSMQTWRRLKYQDAKIIVSAVSESETIAKVEALDTSAKIITLDNDRDKEEIAEEIRDMFRSELE